MKDLKIVRKTLKTIIGNLGHKFCMCSNDWMTNDIVHVEVRRYGGDKFVLSLGVCHKLSTEERNRIWAEEGRKIFDTLNTIGLNPDNTPWGANQYHIMTFEA